MRTQSQQFQDIVNNFTVKSNSYFQIYKYLSGREETNILDKSFMELEECVGYLAYL